MLSIRPIVLLFQSLPIMAACLFIMPSDVRSQAPFRYPAEFLQLRSDQKTYSVEEVRRLADLGRLWGMLHYFNPKMSTGVVQTDSLVLNATRSLISDPSAAGFRNSVAMMLGILNDGNTRIEASSANSPLVFTNGGKLPVVHRLADSTYYISLPAASINMPDDPSGVQGLLPSDWTNARAIILDLRDGKAAEPFAEQNFIYETLPVLIRTIAGGTKLPPVYERSIYHNGFVAQSSTTPNIYSSGWRQSVSGNYSTVSSRSGLGKPVILVCNSNTNIEIIKQFSVLKAAGLCRIVFEGRADEFPTGDTEPVVLADSLTVRVRINEYLLPGNRNLAVPDLIIPRITGMEKDGTFIKQLNTLSLMPAKDQATGSIAQGDFNLPKPSAFAQSQLPEAEKRLYGLYNFWNAIQYFSPYKQLQDGNWDSVIYKFVPVFLHADDTSSYNIALRNLVYETHDSHGFFGSSFPATPARKMYGYWPALELEFIDHRLFVIDIGKDSSQDLTKIHVWDEITSINGLTIAQAKEKWKQYFATSNEGTFERDLTNFLLNGPLNSVVKIGLVRDGKDFVLELKRNGRWTKLSKEKVDFNTRYKPFEELPGNIGYVNMGSLSSSMVDKMLRSLFDTRAIIFDIRNYPQGTAWAIAPRLTDSSRAAVKFDKPFVTYDYLRGGEDKSTLNSFFTVVPAKKKRYKGKVIILCNQETQSQAEYSIMMFQGATSCTVIGSQTAGADGNVTDVLMPGGYTLSFSGLGIYYPDGTGTQRQGIKVDIFSKPTVAGLKAGKDELLERAIRFINEGK